MTENEMEVTPEVETAIREAAMEWGLDPERIRYYYQFGFDAPRPPEPSWKARRWLRRLAKRSGF